MQTNLSTTTSTTTSTIHNHNFWRQDSDIIVTGSGRSGPNEEKYIEFCVHGEPTAFARPGVSHSRNNAMHYYNPRGIQKRKFKAVVDDVAREIGGARPFFGDTDMLSVELNFLLRRPLEHFIGRKRSIGGLIRSKSTEFGCTKGDTDNYIKFALDGLEGIIFKNDRNVGKVIATRTWDSDGLCLGMTKISVTKLIDHNNAI